MKITEGTKRRITILEAKNYKTNYCWVVTSPYIYEDGDFRIEIPEGFLTDGSTCSPDFGTGWIFHDYLYSTHEFCDSKCCERCQADQVMINILRNTGYNSLASTYYASLYSSTVSLISCYNPFYTFSAAWESSGVRGPEFLQM